MKAFVVCSVLALAVLATAEPPVNRYLPPSSAGYRPSGAGGVGVTGLGGGYAGSGGATGFGGGFGGGYGGGKGGADYPSEPANYQFSYEVKDEYGNDFGHTESRQGDVAKGRYYVLLPDGRTQVVEYTADENGYQPQIKYEGQANRGGYQAGGYQGATGGGYQAGGQAGGFGGSGLGGGDGYRY